MDNLITREENDIRSLLSRFRKKDFSGSTGQAIKNSSYQFTANIVAKVGSLLFTIIIARLLLPEKMGLYSLALSTIILFSTFADLGIGTALLTFISKTAGRGNPRKAKAYLEKLLKWKIYVIFGASIFLLSLSYLIANNYYNKPLFYALLVGGLYIPVVSFTGFFEQLFQSLNNFRKPFIKEIIFQLVRLTIVPLIILLLLKSSFSNGIVVALILLSLVVCYAISLLFLTLSAKKRVAFLKCKPSSLSLKEIKSLKKFILPLSFTVLSGIFFGYIDTLMLGHFVSESYIAYYGAAFSLVGSGSAIIGFIATALFPLFSSLKGDSLKRLFNKARNITITLSVIGGIFTYFIAWWVIRIAYDIEYLPAVPILRLFSSLIVFLPIINIYGSFLTSQKKTKVVAGIIFFTTILNIILNLVGIKIGLRYGMFEAVLGACIATIISRFVYLGSLVFWKEFKK